jgi:hypothetical protein
VQYLTFKKGALFNFICLLRAKHALRTSISNDDGSCFTHCYVTLSIDRSPAAAGPLTSRARTDPGQPRRVRAISPRRARKERAKALAPINRRLTEDAADSEWASTANRLQTCIHGLWLLAPPNPSQVHPSPIRASVRPVACAPCRPCRGIGRRIRPEKEIACRMAWVIPAGVGRQCAS